jgi:DNA-binding TFAR19-related protein (PDSD5 family)
LLTSEEIKEILRKRIAEKEKKVNPRRYNLRQVEDALTELETYQSFLVDIMDEEARREMNKSKIKSC